MSSGDDGQTVAWSDREAGAPNALLRRGFTKAYLPPGTAIVVEGFRAKDGLEPSQQALTRHHAGWQEAFPWLVLEPGAPYEEKGK